MAGEEKTEKATPKKRKDTRKKGEGRLSSQVQHFLDKNSRGER
jgi:flagellar biosynthetic protein FlhB